MLINLPYTGFLPLTASLLYWEFLRDGAAYIQELSYLRAKKAPICHWLGLFPGASTPWFFQPALHAHWACPTAKESSQKSCRPGIEKPPVCTGRYMPTRHLFIHRAQHSLLPRVNAYINIFWFKLCFILKMMKHKMYLSTLLCKCYTSTSWEMCAGTSLGLL